MIAAIYTDQLHQLRCLRFSSAADLLDFAAEIADFRPHVDYRTLPVHAAKQLLAQAAQAIAGDGRFAGLVFDAADVMQLHHVMRDIMQHYGSILRELKTDFPPLPETNH